MQVGVLGINHKSSELSLREKVAAACRRCLERLSCSTVLLSTCNRTEVYFSSACLPDTHSEILTELRRYVDAPFEHTLYSYFGGACFTHLALVTAGLDSAIIAESEIQRQVKTAYALASLSQQLPSVLHFLFQKSLKIGKAVRTALSCTQGGGTLEGAVYQACRHVLEKNPEGTVLFLGHSEINRRILDYLSRKGSLHFWLCTRAVHAAQELTLRYGVRVFGWDQLSSWPLAHLLICGTNHSQLVIVPAHLAAHRQTHTQLIIDLSVPRTVDPALARHPQISLLNIEELGSLVENKRTRHASELQQAEASIRAAVAQQVRLYEKRQRGRAWCAFHCA
jgi:glutamyl-tRNA reductase